MFKLKIRSGFTLIELLAVIAVIAILSTITVVTISTSHARFRDAKRISDVKQMQVALELYYADQSRYPVTPAAALGETAAHALCSNGGWKAVCGPSDTVYIAQVPTDPGANKYIYTQESDGSTYVIAFTFEKGIGNLKKGAHTADPTLVE